MGVLDAKAVLAGIGCRAGALTGSGIHVDDCAAFEALPRLVFVLHAVYRAERQSVDVARSGYASSRSREALRDGPERVWWRDLPGKERGEGWWPTFDAVEADAVLGFDPPPEGELDRASRDEMCEVLASVDSAGPATACIAFWGLAAATTAAHFDLGRPLGTKAAATDEIAMSCELSDLGAGMSLPMAFQPSNVWPESRAWFWLTEYDSIATAICCDDRLAERLHANDFLETYEPAAGRTRRHTA